MQTHIATQEMLRVLRLAVFALVCVLIWSGDASAQTFTFTNGPQVPPGAIDEGTATTTFHPGSLYSNGPQVPPGAIDEGTATTTFSVPTDVGPKVLEVRLEITFAKVGGGGCPGPGGNDDYAEEIQFSLTSPTGIIVPLVRFNDYLYSNPDVGQVTVTFDDDAASTVKGLPIQSGTFKPSSGAAMADFNGSDPVGQWTLSLSDNNLQDPLCFASAILTIVGSQFEGSVVDDVRLEITFAKVGGGVVPVPVAMTTMPRRYNSASPVPLELSFRLSGSMTTCTPTPTLARLRSPSTMTQPAP